MDIQTKMNLASAASAAAVVIVLGTTVIWNSQYEIQNGIEQKTTIEQKASKFDDIQEKEYIATGYVSANKSYLMSGATVESQIIGEVYFNDTIDYSIYDSVWYKTKLDGQDAYILAEDVLDTRTEYQAFNIDMTSGFKSYMDYRAITSKSSQQYKLQTLYAYTDKETGIRMIDRRYCVAIGSYFTTEIGQYFDLVLADGTFIPCVLADQKADEHTDDNNIVTIHNGCMSEFIVDSNYLNDDVKKHGDISLCGHDWEAFVAQVRVYDKNVFDEK